MLPPGHAAVGYLLYTAYTRYRYDRPPEGPPTLILLFGTQLPDLIDKPLAWTFQILPSGRTLGHSLLFLVPLVILAYLVAVRYQRSEWAIALAIGAISHAIVDILPPVLRGEFQYATSILWPLLPPPAFEDHDRTIIGHLLSVEPTPILAFEFVLALVAFVVWWREGKPGLETVRNLTEWRSSG